MLCWFVKIQNGEKIGEWLKMARFKHGVIPKSKVINGVLRLPVEILDKGRDWVYCRYISSDGSPNPYTQKVMSTDYGYNQLKRVAVGGWAYMPRKKLTKKDARIVLNALFKHKKRAKKL
jgi:hypothetical protein